MGNYDLFNATFNDLMTLGFGKPSVKYSTPGTKDLMPSFWSKWTEERVVEKELEEEKTKKKLNKKTEEKDTNALDQERVQETPETEIVELGYKCVARTVGINPSDIKITMEDYGLLLEGETEVEGFTYSQRIEMPISKEVMSNLEGINYKSENGLTRIYLKIKTPTYKNIEINQID